MMTGWCPAEPGLVLPENARLWCHDLRYRTLPQCATGWRVSRPPAMTVLRELIAGGIGPAGGGRTELAEAVRFELTEGFPLRWFSRPVP